MGARAVSVDIPGLNLLLGGGVFVLRRAKDLDESTSILFRGPPGSGKTVFGLQLAGSLARSFGADVAYGCVEILPTELAAQHAGITKEGLPERVVIAEAGEDETGGARFPTQGPSNGECRIFAGTLDIGAAGEEQGRIVPAVTGLLEEIEQAGGRARVLVLDSLSDGYNLGSAAPRVLADEICKMAAARGMVVILLEEAVDEKPSNWSFATDVVIELGLEASAITETNDRRDKRLAVRKNRFGASVAGSQVFKILPINGIHVQPDPAAYLSPWVSNSYFSSVNNPPQRSQRWLRDWDVPNNFPQFSECSTVVTGPQEYVTKIAALRLGATCTGSDVFVGFGLLVTNIESRIRRIGEHVSLQCCDPSMGGHTLIADLLSTLSLFSGQSIRRVIIGDLQFLRSFRNHESIKNTFPVIASILRRLRIPLIFFETGSRKDTPDPSVGGFVDIVAYSANPPTTSTLNISLTDVSTGAIVQSSTSLR